MSVPSGGAVGKTRVRVSVDDRLAIRYGGVRPRMLAVAAVTLGAVLLAPWPAWAQRTVIGREEAREIAREKGWLIRRDTPTGAIELQAIVNGCPRYYATHNTDAADSISTDECLFGGVSGLDLTGSGVTLGIWDGGGVLTTHQEFGGRASQIDAPGSTHYHATHVAGTMIASGVVGPAKGMSPFAALDCYDWDDDTSEMDSAAGLGLRISNHSYSYISGWDYNTFGDNEWVWWGFTVVSAVEDYAFGLYSGYTWELDSIAHDNPRYLMCRSAGNDRSDDGPGPGGGHWYWNPYAGEWSWSTATRDPDGDYDCIGEEGIAKNILTVAAAEDVIGGYTNPAGVVMSTFSSWGPADDGRIKPDITGNGIGLYSTWDTSNSSYDTISGTSMSSPNVSGSLGLLIEHWRDTHPTEGDMRSATLKGLVLHTADEAGAANGPDYAFGWGLMNTLKAADVITTDVSQPSTIIEHTLNNGQTYELGVSTHGGTNELRATICWTDPPGTPPGDLLDPPDKMLVNDLDLRIVSDPPGSTHYPWVLDGSNPSASATTGDNNTDNVEQVLVNGPGDAQWTVRVTHEDTLSGGSQDFSLIITGAESGEPPTAQNVQISTPKDMPASIILLAGDDGLPDPPGALSFIIDSLPTHGSLHDPGAGSITTTPYTLVANGNIVNYFPASGYEGGDGFTFYADDGGTPPFGGSSNVATVSIGVGALCTYTEDFEDGPGGFIIENNIGAPGAGDGLWHFTEACEATSAALYYGVDSQCDYDAGWTEGAATSPEISLDGLSGTITLSFMYYLETEHVEGWDVAWVSVSVDGLPFKTVAGNWPDLGLGEVQLDDPSGGWVSTGAIPLPTHATSEHIRIRFQFATVDHVYNDHEGFYVDDIQVCGGGVPCTKPPEPADPEVNGTTNGVVTLPEFVTLSWTGDDSECGTVYDVYLGTVDPPPWGALVLGDLTEPVCDVGVIDELCTYYWTVVAKNSEGSTSGPVWSFTTDPAPDPNEVRIAPVIRRERTPDWGTPYPGSEPPPSDAWALPDSSVYVEIWASNAEGEQPGLECVAEDVIYAFTDMWDALTVEDGPRFPANPLSPEKDQLNGTYGDLSGCQETEIEFLGADEWVLVDRIMMHTAATADGQVYVRQDDAEPFLAGVKLVGPDPIDIDACRVNFEDSPWFEIRECDKAPKGDRDGDGDVDASDLSEFTTCFTGPCVAPPCHPSLPLYADPCCVILDFDTDGDVDLEDYAAFQVVADPTNIAEALSAYYPFVGNAEDCASSNGYDGTAQGGVSYVRGQYGLGADFDGVDGLIELSGPFDSLMSGDYTVAFWLKTTDTQGYILHAMDAPQSSTGTTFLVAADASEVWAFQRGFGLEDDVGVSDAQDGQWHHLAFVRKVTDDTMEVHAYRNGSLCDATAPVALEEADPTQFAIGAPVPGCQGCPTDQYYEGLLDDLRIYDRALTKKEIQELAGM